MRRTHLVLATLVLAAGCRQPAGQAREAIVSSDTRDVPVTGIVHAVDVRGPDDVTITHGPALKVSATGPRALLDRLSIRTEARRLVIDRQPGSVSQRGAKITVTLPDIDGVAIDGSADVTLDRGDGPDFVAALTGSGELSIGALDVSTAAFGLEGSGGASAAGRVATLRVSLAGSGDAAFGRLAADRVTVSADGSGNVEVGTATTVTGAVSGSGDLRVAGRPSCTVSRSGSGEVRCGD